jgi:hypothetical protein
MSARRANADPAEGVPLMAQDPKNAAANAQEGFFAATDRIPEEVWYWAAIASIGISAILKVLKQDNWALFVGQWPPTFLILAIFHKVLRPSR